MSPQICSTCGTTKAAIARTSDDQCRPINTTDEKRKKQTRSGK